MTGVVDVAGYLGRLGLDHPGPPSAQALAAIHRAHVRAVPYTTIDIHRGRPGPVDARQSAARVVTTGRAGYCFHLNGALSALLGALGFDVRWHRGSVWRRPEDASTDPMPNHLALTVHGLECDEAPDGVWFVDVGLGDALYEPIPLRAGEVIQGPFRYQLSPSPSVPGGGWRFRHDPTGGFVGMDFELREASVSDFEASHAHLSTSPDSPFVQFITAQRREATGVDRLISTTLRRVDAAGWTAREITSAAEWFAVLVDVFGQSLEDCDEAERLVLWRRARRAQDEWNAKPTANASADGTASADTTASADATADAPRHAAS
jgi:N-hydroxyarylamine O-acetyltransferase